MPCLTYLPGWSEIRNSLDRFVEVSTRNNFFTTRSGILARLSQKLMGDQNGLCPVEEVFSLSTVDEGVIIPLGCNEPTLAEDVIQKGIDCYGNVVDIETRGGQADSPLCRSYPRGSFAVGVDAYRPEFYSYEFRFPTVCVDAAMASPKEVKATLNAITQQGPNMVISNLEWLMWDLIVKRGTGNTSIAENVVFGSDVGLSAGQFPFAPKSHLNHRFLKRMQEIVMIDPDNRGKTFNVEASELQISKAIEDDQRLFGIERRALGNSLPMPYRVEETRVYDGIRYIVKEMADFVGLIDYGTYSTFVRPRRHVHQAGSVHGVVARPNYELTRGGTINCNGYLRDKLEVAHWYLDDAVSFVPFRAPGNVPTNGKEQIKDHVYASPTSFKMYDVEPHAVDIGTCINDRGQFQQWGMMTRFGLFNRPDRNNFGAILLTPAHQIIVLATSQLPEDSAACVPATKEIHAADRGFPLATNCAPCDGSGLLESMGDELSDMPTVTTEPPYSDTLPGEFRIVGSTFKAVEGVNTVLSVCVERYGGNLGAAAIDYVTADGTATAGVNYTAATGGAFEWADGESGVKCVDIPILVEPILEADSPKDFAFDITAVELEEIVGAESATGFIYSAPPCDPETDCPC